MKTQKLKKENLISIFSNWDKATDDSNKIVNQSTTEVVIDITSFSQADQRKTDNAYFPIFKLSKIKGTLGLPYQEAVNIQRVQEGNLNEFVAKPRKWGVHVSTVLIEHKGNHYVNVINPSSYENKYVYKKDNVWTEVPEKELGRFVDTKGSESNTQETKTEVIFRTYGINNIMNLSLDGQQYDIIDNITDDVKPVLC